MSTRRCIVSFANKNGNYIKGLARLGESLRNNFNGEFLGFIGEQSMGCPLHSAMPYAFKIHAIQKAIDAGFDQILWLDSSCFAIKNVNSIFDTIEKDGCIFQEAGHMLGTWTNDKTLKYFNLTRDEAMNIRMVGNAGFLGLNLRNPTAKQFFIRWKKACQDGMFAGAWTNDGSESKDERCKGHRHDMSCSSALVHTMGLSELIKPGNEILQYAGLYDETLNDTIIFKAQGL